MKLLERESFLEKLTTLLNDAAAGNGCTVLLSGEAGIGKSSLIEHFTQQHLDATRVLWGACEALFTPRPLGPLHDVAFQIEGALPSLLEAQASRSTIFSALLSELSVEGSPTILVFEDVHWADEATLDLIKFLGRRVHRTSTLFLVSYRDDEFGTDHPLRMVLGDLPRPHTHRMELPPLSQPAVAALVQTTGRSPDDLYAVTGGNPFFVTEVLASGSGSVPASVRDAVLARVARLSGAVQQVLELVSVIPAKTERWLLKDLLPSSSPVLDECLASGMLRLDGEAVAFRHELARRAVEGALTAPRRQELHGQVLAALSSRDHREVARLAHHADQASDHTAVLRWAPEAARQAAALGAHREAAAHYETALRYSDGLPREERIGLLEAWSYECYLTHQLEKALQARHMTLDLWTALGRRREEGLSLHWISRLNWFLGRREDAERYAEKALAVLESLPPGYELAYAYCNRANLHMLSEETTAAIRLASQAIELVQDIGVEEGFPTETLINSLHSIGVSLLLEQDDSWRWSDDCAIAPPGLELGRAELEKSLKLAIEQGYHEHAARAYTNLACQAVLLRDYDQATQYFAAGLGYCTERDLDSWSLYMTAYRARMHFERGAWDAATRDANQVLSHSGAYSIAKIPALVILGRVGVRRGSPSAASLLDEARELAQNTEDLEHIAPVAAARAETAWFLGDAQGVRAEIQIGFELAQRNKRPWTLGEMGFWMWRAGGLEEPPHGAALPFALQMAGNWRAAADAWHRIGCPFEEALALADGDEAAQLEALRLFEQLGAVPASAMLRRTMQARGVQGIPRGPRSSTKNNPHALTTRQMDVLILLSEGLTNIDIAERLFISPKTVDHHVSAILSKLEVSSRTEAVTFAHEHKLLPDAAPSSE